MVGAILSALNVEPHLRGVPPVVMDRAAVLVANHVSWLDIPLVHSVWQVRFIAKSEVRRWPLIGWLSARTGTLFIQRGKSRHAARINKAIHAAFLAGDAIGVFSRGTTIVAPGCNLPASLLPRGGRARIGFRGPAILDGEGGECHAAMRRQS